MGFLFITERGLLLYYLHVKLLPFKARKDVAESVACDFCECDEEIGCLLFWRKIDFFCGLTKNSEHCDPYAGFLFFLFYMIQRETDVGTRYLGYGVSPRY